VRPRPDTASPDTRSSRPGIRSRSLASRSSPGFPHRLGTASDGALIRNAG